jgi:hypothetical protein
VPVGAVPGAPSEGACAERGPWNGVVDELHIYDYALTLDQVSDDMRKPLD